MRHSVKKTILIFLLGICISTLTAQTESELYRKTVDRFITNYNSDKTDKIFDQLAPEMQNILTKEKTRAFMGRLKQQLGNIESCDFIEFKSLLAIYKTRFERGVIALNISVNSDTKIDGLAFRPYTNKRLPVIERTKTILQLPFRGEWYTWQGGDTEKLNHHVSVKSQKGAFDFVVVDDKQKPFKGRGVRNEDFYCFGKVIVSPCEAEVVMAVDGIKDNIPGEINQIFPLGNTVILKTANNEYLYFCHLKQFSVSVKQGQKVKAGDLLGLCGNSGRSTAAHLHFHVQNVENMEIATGVKCFFGNILVNGKEKKDYSPVKRDKIKNK